MAAPDPSPASMSGSSSSRDRPVRTPFAVHVACYVLLGGLLGYVLAVRWFRPVQIGEPIAVEPALVDQVDRRIDPNTASWAELTALPGIGETLARRIVRYRESRAGAGALAPTRPAVVFRCPEDLAQVRGIGPKTVARIAPYLKFPPQADGPAE